MVKKLPILATAMLLSLICSFNAFSQVRIAFLPFQNRDGDMRLNVICYKLQDSVASAFRESDLNNKAYVVVPSDSVEAMLAEFNVDPANPQYISDMWKAVKALNIQKVVSGNFSLQADRVLINAYVYDVKTKLANPKFQAKDIFKAEDAVLEAVPVIFQKLSPVFISN